MHRSVKIVRVNKNIGFICLAVLSFLAIFTFTHINKANAINESSNIISPFAANSFDLSSSVSKTEVTSYSDQVVINFTIKHLDISSSLYGGNLEIDFSGNNFDPINFAKDSVANPNVQSASYNNVTKILSVNFKTPILTGSVFDYSVVTTVSPLANDGDALSIGAKLSGKNQSSVSYSPESITTSPIAVKMPGETPEKVDPANPQWKFNVAPNGTLTQLKEYNLYPGQAPTGGAYHWLSLYDDSHASFENLKIKLEKSANVGNNYNLGSSVRVAPKGSNSANMTVVPGRRLSNTSTEQISEYGQINGFNNGEILVFLDGKVSAAATPGEVYSMKMTIMDGDTVILNGEIRITVIDVNTTVSVNTGVRPAVVNQPSGSDYDYFDFYVSNNIATAGNGVKDYAATINIPNGISPAAFYSPSGRGLVKKVEVYHDGQWNDYTDKRSNDWSSFDLTDVPDGAEKLRYTFIDITMTNAQITYNHPYIRFINKTYMKGEKITIGLDEVTYKDHNSVQQTLTGLNVYNRQITVSGNDSELTNMANANVMPSANRSPVQWDTPRFNGEDVYQSVRVGSTQNNLRDPYIWMIAPKGLTVNSTDTVMKLMRPYSTGFLVYDISTLGQPITYPKSAQDIKYEKVDLNDGNVLHFWSVEGISLKGNGASQSQVMGGDMSYKISNMSSGIYDISYGMGSLTDGSYGVSGGTPYGGLQFTNTNVNVKEKIAKVISDKEFTTTKKLVIGVNNSVNAKMEIKGSQDSSFIDATTGTATSIPGKKVDYQVTLSNAGTNDLTNFEAVEILPFLGDKLSTDPNQARNSQFNVNLGSKPKVLIDGIESTDAEILYSLSNDPVRFDANGNQIGTGTWTNIPPTDLSTVKAIKVAMKTKPFKIGSVMQLDFSGTLPLDAPRNGEIAYNTIAMKADTITVTGPGIFVSEPAKGGVKSTAPATDIELSGKIYMDFDKSGSVSSGEIGYNGVTLNLYKKNGVNFEKIETLVTAPDGSNNAGIFGFTGIDNGTYKIEVVKPDLASFVTNGANSFEIISDEKAWLKLNGSTELSVDDLAAGNPEKITNLAGPLYAESEFKGEIKFVDKNGSEVSGDSYGEGFKIQLQDASGTDIGSPVFSDENGKFVISHLVTQIEDYKIVIMKPKAGFNYPAAENSPDFDILTETYTYKSVNPAHSVLANISISDSDLPTVEINLDKNDNPTNITVNPEDETTKTTVEWVIKKDGIVISTGTGNVIIPTEYGEYTIEAIARDAAQNESELKSVKFTISDIITPEPNPDEDTDNKEMVVPNTGYKKR